MQNPKAGCKSLGTTMQIFEEIEIECLYIKYEVLGCLFILL